MTTDGKSAKKHAKKTPAHSRLARESSNNDAYTTHATVTERRLPAGEESNDGHNSSSSSVTRKIYFPQPFVQALPLRIGTLMSLVANRRPSNSSISSDKEATRKSSISLKTDSSSNNKEDCADSDKLMKKRFSFPFILTTPNELNSSLTSSCDEDISNVPPRKLTTILKPRTKSDQPSLRSLPHIGADSNMFGDRTNETNNEFRSLCGDVQLAPGAASLNPVINNAVVVPARRPPSMQTNAQLPQLDAARGMRRNEQNENKLSSFTFIPEHTAVQRDDPLQTPRKTTATGQSRIPSNIHENKLNSDASSTPVFSSISPIKYESPALPFERKSNTSDRKKYSSLQPCATRSERADRTAWETTSTNDGLNEEMDKSMTNSTQDFASSAFAGEVYTTPLQCERTKKVAASTAWKSNKTDETNEEMDQTTIYSTPDFALKPSLPPLPSLSSTEVTQEPISSVFLRKFHLRGSTSNKNLHTNNKNARSRESSS